MQTLTDVRQRLAERQAGRSMLEVPVNSLSLDESGRLRVSGGTFILSDEARVTLAVRASIPPSFLNKCPTDVQAYLFNRLYPQALGDRGSDDATGLILENDAVVVGIVDPKLSCLSGAEVLEAVLDAKPEAVSEEELEVTQFELNGVLRLSVVSHVLQTEPRVGDLVRAGVDVWHSDTGLSATQVESYMLRLACLNGLMVKVCAHGDGCGSRIRRAAAHNRRQTLRRVEEVARKAWRELDAKLAAMRILASERVDNPADLIQAIAEKLRFPESLVSRILEALDADEMGPSGSLWDLVNAFSRVGTHDERLSSATHRFLQELSGHLIQERLERCPSCGRVQRGMPRYLPRR